MKKSKKILLRILPILMIGLLLVTSNVFAASNKKSTQKKDTSTSTAIEAKAPDKGSEITEVTSLGKDIWSTLTVIVQIAAIAAIVFAGVRYMFASAEDKADIKKQTVILIVGAALVFAAVPIAKFIQSTAETMFNK